jgi:hypothetical protein
MKRLRNVFLLIGFCSSAVNEACLSTYALPTASRICLDVGELTTAPEFDEDTVTSEGVRLEINAPMAMIAARMKVDK